MIKRTFDPGFRIDLHQKDLNLALAGARELKLSLPNTATCQELFNACAANDHASRDHSALVRALEAWPTTRSRRPVRAPATTEKYFRRMNPSSPCELLRSLFDAAVEAALPRAVMPSHLPPAPKGRTVVVGAGKASAAMANAVEEHWPGPLEGLVVTRYGHAVPCERIEIVEAAHPVPDARGKTPRGAFSRPCGAWARTISCWR